LDPNFFSPDYFNCLFINNYPNYNPYFKKGYYVYYSNENGGTFNFCKDSTQVRFKIPVPKEGAIIQNVRDKYSIIIFDCPYKMLYFYNDIVKAFISNDRPLFIKKKNYNGSYEVVDCVSFNCFKLADSVDLNKLYLSTLC